MMQKPQHMAYHHAAAAAAAHAAAAAASASSAASQPGSLTHGAWQSTLSNEGGRQGGPQLVIPRAKVKPRSSHQGYNSDDDRLSAAEVSFENL